MFFAWDITVSANTTEASPKTQLLKLSKGVITRCDVKFRSGCHHLVKVRLMRSEFQLVPLSKDEWVTGDGETVPTEGYYELTETPSELKFVAASPGTNYDHVITVRILVLPKSVATFMPLVEVLTSFLRKIGVIRS